MHYFYGKFHHLIPAPSHLSKRPDHPFFCIPNILNIFYEKKVIESYGSCYLAVVFFNSMLLHAQCEYWFRSGGSASPADEYVVLGGQWTDVYVLFGGDGRYHTMYTGQ